MECPSCHTLIGDSDICERCGAELSLFKRVLYSRNCPPEAHPVAFDEVPLEVEPPTSVHQPLPSQSAPPRPYRAVSRAHRTQPQSESGKKKIRYRRPTEPRLHKQVYQDDFPPQDASPPPPAELSEPLDQSANGSRSEINPLFYKLYDSLAESPEPLNREIELTDLVVRERSERLDLLFHLLDESVSPVAVKREFVELPRIPPESKTATSPELQRTLSQAVQESISADRVTGEASPSLWSQPGIEASLPIEILRLRAPSPSRLACLLAAVTDLLMSETLVAIFLSMSGVVLPFHRPQLITIADDLYSATLLVAFLLPSFCAYRAILLLTTGTTLGYLIYGITPISRDGHTPSRLQLILRAVVSPVVGLLSAPFAFFGAKRDLSGTRLIKTTQELVLKEKIRAVHRVSVSE